MRYTYGITKFSVLEERVMSAMTVATSFERGYAKILLVS